MIAIISFTEKGNSLAKNISQNLILQGLACSVNSARKNAEENFIKTDAWVAKNFKTGNVLLFIGACGIAVRAIAPFVKDKALDPAVLVMDEGARFAIPVLSGHLGGANDFARKLAELTKAIPVITTATDVNNLFSVDSFAKRNSMQISDMKLVKKFSSELLKEKKCNLLFSDKISECIKIKNSIPKDIRLSTVYNEDDDIPSVLISPFKNISEEKILRLIPKCLVLGVGCRRGKAAAELKDFICRELDKIAVDINAIASLCSIDLKESEVALISFCKDYALPLKVFSSQELMAVSGNFSASAFVKEITGVDNVCERSLIAGGAKQIILGKTKFDGMTLAIGCMEVPVYFSSGV